MIIIQNVSDMKVLNITLKAKWYDMIESVVKKE